MQCFTGKIAILQKKTLKLNSDGSHFKVYSDGCPWQTRKEQQSCDGTAIAWRRYIS